jgi:hypothetical protein
MKKQAIRPTGILRSLLPLALHLLLGGCLAADDADPLESATASLSACEQLCTERTWIPCIEYYCPRGYLDCDEDWAIELCTAQYDLCVDVQRRYGPAGSCDEPSAAPDPGGSPPPEPTQPAPAPCVPSTCRQACQDDCGNYSAACCAIQPAACTPTACVEPCIDDCRNYDDACCAPG